MIRRGELMVKTKWISPQIFTDEQKVEIVSAKATLQPGRNRPFLALLLAECWRIGLRDRGEALPCRSHTVKFRSHELSRLSSRQGEVLRPSTRPQDDKLLAFASLHYSNTPSAALLRPQRSHADSPAWRAGRAGSRPGARQRQVVLEVTRAKRWFGLTS